MKISHSLIVAAAIIGLGAGAEAAAPAFKGAALIKQARISLSTARRIALKARPGTITDQELEKEKGGSGLRYSFDITAGGHPFEVGVDAKTGAVLENGVEGKNPD